jgi:hypothetical protein
VKQRELARLERREHFSSAACDLEETLLHRRVDGDGIAEEDQDSLRAVWSRDEKSSAIRRNCVVRFLAPLVAARGTTERQEGNSELSKQWKPRKLIRGTQSRRPGGVKIDALGCQQNSDHVARVTRR